MYDEHEEQTGTGIRPGIGLSEAAREDLSQTNRTKEGLQNNQAGEGRELLPFKGQLRNRMGFTDSLRT